jgi:hypothetical protein
MLKIGEFGNLQIGRKIKHVGMPNMAIMKETFSYNSLIYL